MKNKYNIPASIKLIEGEFFYGETITISVDGKEMKRKVHYAGLEGLFIIIGGTKYGFTQFDK